MPATNAVNERSFDALRRVKRHRTAYSHWTGPNYWCLTLDAHKERTDALSMTSIVNEFVSWNPSRMNIFGKFEN